MQRDSRTTPNTQVSTPLRSTHQNIVISSAGTFAVSAELQCRLTLLFPRSRMPHSAFASKDLSFSNWRPSRLAYNTMGDARFLLRKTQIFLCLPRNLPRPPPPPPPPLPAAPAPIAFVLASSFAYLSRFLYCSFSLLQHLSHFFRFFHSHTHTHTLVFSFISHVSLTNLSSFTTYSCAFCSIILFISASCFSYRFSCCSIYLSRFLVCLIFLLCSLYLSDPFFSVSVVSLSSLFLLSRLPLSHLPCLSFLIVFDKSIHLGPLLQSLETHMCAQQPIRVA